MTKGSRALALVFAVTLSVTLSSCSSGPGNTAGPDGSSGAPVSAEQTATVGEGTGTVVPGQSGSSAEKRSLDQQLDAMQKELDDLKMPSDSDFGDAENALY